MHPGGQTWPLSFVLEEGGAAYCSLGMLSSGALCVMCAHGPYTPLYLHPPPCPPVHPLTPLHTPHIFSYTPVRPLSSPYTLSHPAHTPFTPSRHSPHPCCRYERADRISFATIAPSTHGPLGAF